MKKRLILFVLCTLALSSFAATYYASPKGAGDGFSYETPTTFSNGLLLLKSPGDTLYLLAGQYDLDKTTVQNLNGTKQKRIVIAGYAPMNSKGSYDAILDFRTTPYGTRGLQIKNTCTYLHIKNLTLRYSGKNNLYNEGSFCLFENLDIYGSGDTGCQMKNGGDNIIKNVDSHHNFDYQTMSGNTANFGGNADGFADKQFTGNGNHYIGCRAWCNSDDGWDFFQRVSNTQTIMEYCVCYQNGPATYDMTNNPRYETDKAWFDSKVGTTMTDRYGNTIKVTLDKYPCQGNGNGFKMGGQYTNHLVTVHHCLAVANNTRGFDQNNNDGTMWLYNNSAYANTVNYGFTTAYGTNTLQNNISLNSINGDSYKSKNLAVNDHNSWNSGFTCAVSDFQSLDTTQILAIRQPDGSLTEGTFMRLVDGSKLIDAGVEVGLSFMGDAPDLGCYETDGIIRPFVKCLSDNTEQWIVEHEAIEPIVFQWGGAATGLTCTALPNGLTQTLNTEEQTLTIQGIPEASGTYTFTVTTISELDNPSLSATIHVQSASAHRVAFVTLPGSTEDQALLAHLRCNDSLLIEETNAGDNTTDYSDYDVIVLGSKPKSSAAGYTALKGYDRPMLILKPFLFKSGVWSWGAAVNTSDLSVSITNSTHPIFLNLPIIDGELQLFEQCNTNAVTAISTWNNTEGYTLLATPTSNNTYTTIAELPTGTDCNGTILPQKMLMIGVSEYSTAYLTHAGKRLIENAICYLLGMAIPTHTEHISATKPIASKYIHNGQIYIRINQQLYTITGQKIQ